MRLSAGERLDRYVLLEPIGEGGQGAVWKVEDPIEGGVVRALKVVELANARPADAERVRREARALASLSHPSLVKCHALFEDFRRGLLGIVLDFVDGPSVAGLGDDPRFTEPYRQAVLRHVARALAHLHEHGIVHRDLKPENIVTTSSLWGAPDDAKVVRLVDFGIAVPHGNPTPLTEVGRTIGTIAYMPPEAMDPSSWHERRATPTGDVFAFGVLGWMLLTGHHPADLGPKATLADYAANYREAARWSVGWPRGAHPPEPWGTLLSRCLRVDATERPSSARELVAALDQGAGRSPSTSRTATQPHAHVAATPSETTPPPNRTIPASPLTSPSTAVSSVMVGTPPRRAGFDRTSGIMTLAVIVAAAGVLLIAATLFQRFGAPAGTGGDEPPSSSPTPSASATPLHADAEPSTTPNVPTTCPRCCSARAEGSVNECRGTECPSRRACSNLDCEPDLDPTKRWRLRLGTLKPTSSLVGPQQVCLRRPPPAAEWSCTVWDPGGTPPAALHRALVVTIDELSRDGLDVHVGPAPALPRDAPQYRAAVRLSPVYGNALCLGLTLRGTSGEHVVVVNLEDL